MAENSEKITYESLWKAIIRPPRDYYREEDLGPSAFEFNGRLYIRKDFEILDFRGKLLKLSFIEPESKERPADVMPCVIYIHANSSSRVEGINNKKYLLKNDINICTFDFEGSGYSEGEYISLGYHEKYQVKNVVDFVEKYPGVGEIGLWGRSMGAATTLIYASMDKRIKAVVVDSPFSDFRRVAKEMCLAQISIPGFLIEGAISIIGKSVFKKNGMKINEIKAIDAVKNCNIPVIFIHAKDDNIVNYQHSLDLFKNYAGNDKELKEVLGGHNGKRPNLLLQHVGRFFFSHLKTFAINNNFNEISDSKNVESFNYSSTFNKKEANYFNHLNFDLKKRKRKTIYEEWEIHDKNINIRNNILECNIEKNKVNENNEHDKKTLINKGEEDKKDNKNNEIINNIYKNYNASSYFSSDNTNKELIKQLPNIIECKSQILDSNIDINNNDINNSKKEDIINNNIINEFNYDSNINKVTIKRKTIYDDLRIRK